MSSNGNFGRYRDNVSRDADDIAGFFSTRAGTITAISLATAVLLGIVGGAIAGLFA